MSEQINKIFLWPKTREIPVRQMGSPLYKPDPLLMRLESLITAQQAWGPIKGTTKRTESEEKLSRWIAEQARKLRTLQLRHAFRYDYGVNLRLSDFPENRTTANTRVVTTSSNIAYLIDNTSSFIESVKGAFGDLVSASATHLLEPNVGTFVYVTNSVESGGRAFSGDPFTGQVAAYSRIFAHDMFGNRVLNFVAYYPHQLYSQFYQNTGAIPNNKGVKMLRSQATLIITCGGVLLEPKEWKIVNEPPV